MSVHDPHAEYSARLAARRAAVEREQRLHIQVGNLRLGVVLAGVAIAWASLAREAMSLAWVLVPVAALVALLVYHERVLRRKQLAKRAVRIYERGIARIEDRWAGMGEAGERFRDSAHPYAEDLDLFGKGGLFELLSTCRTRPCA